MAVRRKKRYTGFKDEYGQDSSDTNAPGQSPLQKGTPVFGAQVLFMKIFVASDIHGSATGCDSMIEAFHREKAGRMILLGDLLYHGPRNDLPDGYEPKKVIDLLNGLNTAVYCVRGNCEAEVDQMVLNFPVMADYALFPYGDRMIFVTHGHVFNTSHLPPLRKGDILLHGHTHIPAWEEHEEYWYLNPGSVSIPKNGTPKGYMIFEAGNVVWKTLEGEEYHRICLYE